MVFGTDSPLFHCGLTAEAAGIIRNVRATATGPDLWVRLQPKFIIDTTLRRKAYGRPRRLSRVITEPW